MKILVLGGGHSPERAVSLRSAAAVSKALRSAGFEVIEADPAENYSILDSLDRNTIVFPILHGEGGEDGTIQRELENRGISFLGTGSAASATCFDKWLTRVALEDHDIPVARGELVTEKTYRNSTLFREPHVLKAVGGGSSIGTYIVRRPKQIDTQEVKAVFKVSEKAVIEELVEGIEITVPILDNRALPVIEIQPPPGGEFDYENKYNDKTREICPPETVNVSLQSQASELAEKAHTVLGCRHLSRVDLIVQPNGKMVILETNTIPGLTDQSLYPKSAQVAGLSFPALMERFVNLVERDFSLEKV